MLRGVVGVLVLAVFSGCDGKSAEPGGDHSAGGTSGSGNGGSAGTGASKGTAGSSGRGGAGGGAGTGGKAGSGAGGTGGSASTAGSSGVGDSNTTAGKGGGGGTAGDDGTSGSSGEGGGASDAITWNNRGVIAPTGNDFGIQGSWFFRTDCPDAMPENLPCTIPDPSLVGPDMLPGWTVLPSQVCAKGTAPQVVMESYELEWGAELGFELNDGAAFDAEAAGIRGFTFDIASQVVPAWPPTLRVSYVTTQTTSDTAHFMEVQLPASSPNLLFSNALQGSWVTNPIPLDASAITAVTFRVYTNVSAPKPFDFCVSNARVLR
jgi:hypothetical protein